MRRAMEIVDKPFFAIPKKSPIAFDLLMTALACGKWEEYYNFKAVRLDIDYIIERCPFLNYIYKYHRFTPGLLRMDPYTYYNWHIDDKRGVSINMLINAHSESHCLFSPDPSLTSEFIELPYRPATYYLFNNQVHHSVYNFGRIRYLFSIEFNETKELLSFSTLFKEVLDEFLIEGKPKDEAQRSRKRK